MYLWLAIVGIFLLLIAVVFGVWQSVRKHDLDMYLRFIEYENACLRAELASLDPKNPKLDSNKK